MIPFDLEKALTGEKVVNKDGKEYEQFHLFKLMYHLPPLACVAKETGAIHFLFEDGSINGKALLFMAPKKIKLFIGIKKTPFSCNPDKRYHSYAFEDKEILISHLAHDLQYYKIIEIEIDEE